MSLTLILVLVFAYVTLLFLIAWWVDQQALKGVSWVNNGYVYALSLTVYCTAWTFYGSVGRATTSGLSFLGVYLGPTLLAPLWLMVLKKIMLICKSQRLTSIADFIVARYGKQTILGVIVTVIAILGIVPYISIQIKAVTFGIQTLLQHAQSANPNSHLPDLAIGVTVAMGIFTMLFGFRKLDPYERHEGLVAAIAFESIVKLVSFLAVGVFVTFFVFDGFGDLFTKALQQTATAKLFSLESMGVMPFSWNILMLLSLFAVLLLPRQFHISVVESSSPRHVDKAMWLFPLYLLLINVFVFPLALAGKMLLSPSVHPDTYVLSLPLYEGANGLALMVFIGGFSAAMGMIVIETMALSIMLSNYVIIPVLIQVNAIGNKQQKVSGAARVLDVRRISVLLLLLLAYLYQKGPGSGEDLVSVGLISFAAASQFAPALIGGLYWTRATSQGAIAGLVTGFLIWGYCLPISSLAHAGVISDRFMQEGLMGFGWLKPYGLFGLEGLDPVTHAGFWSLLFNVLAYTGVSLFTKPSALNLAQADIFVNIEKYADRQDYEVLQRSAPMIKLREVFARFMGEERAAQMLHDYAKQNHLDLAQLQVAGAELVNFVETHLAAVIGAGSARLVLEKIATAEAISITELIRILEQTKEAVAHSRMMEEKNDELNAITLQLTEANLQLKQLDRLKADFVTTVTHELRTPVTSIKSLSKIMLDYRSELSDDKMTEYLRVLVQESDRISRLINQVLDIEKLETEFNFVPLEPVNWANIVLETAQNMRPVFDQDKIEFQVSIPANGAVSVMGNRDRLVQVLVNLLANARKFCHPEKGRVVVALRCDEQHAYLSCTDNGQGIPAHLHNLIFEKFTQLEHREKGKPQGTGLGLFITKTIIEQHKGTIAIESEPGVGTTFLVQLPLIHT
jgi:Na+/proline symporter/nitrogen-specific signal transduction histidine kinase